MQTTQSYNYVYSPTLGGWKPVEFNATPNGSDTPLTVWSRVTGLASPNVEGSRIECSAGFVSASFVVDSNPNILDPRGLFTIATQYAMNAAGTSLVPGRMVDETAASLAPVANASLRGASLHYAFDGTNFIRALTATATTLSSFSPAGAQLMQAPGQWSINHTPVANTQATITRAAGAAGQRHVCKSITATLIGLAASAEATVLVNLRDGTTGVGTILWSTRLLVVGGSGSQTGVSLPDVNIVGSAATAMTLEFSAAGGASTFEAVALTGITTS